jgi:cytochrome c biogenesis protein CcdA
MKVDNNLLLGILAVVAGVMVLAWNDALQWIVGIFLIVWGVLLLLGKK